MFDSMVEWLLELNATMSRSYSRFYGHFVKPASRKVVKFSKSIYGNHSTKTWGFQSFTALFMIGSFLCFLVVIGSSYHYSLPPETTIVNQYGSQNKNITMPSVVASASSCNLFEGKWVVDDSYPLYNASQCPFAERGFNCLANGRKDQGYLKWKWKPNGCEIQRFDARAVLEKLGGKRVVFVGDSLSRTQWESMICMLMTGVEDKNSVFEVNGNKITKQIRHLAVRFSSFGLSVEFYRSIFLVKPGPAPRHSPKRVKMALKLDQMDESSREWMDSDILVFNSGHWWTPTKLFELGWYFQVGERMRLGMTINRGFRIALTTWQTWIENSVDPKRTQVFFRTFESTHWRRGSRQNCKVTKEPLSEVKERQPNVISDAIVNTMKNVSIPVKLLHVTSMGAYRSDAHVGTWSDNPSVPDCSHWCLPGLPDTWNELLFSFLLSK